MRRSGAFGGWAETAQGSKHKTRLASRKTHVSIRESGRDIELTLLWLRTWRCSLKDAEASLLLCGLKMPEFEEIKPFQWLQSKKLRFATSQKFRDLYQSEVVLWLASDSSLLK